MSDTVSDIRIGLSREPDFGYKEGDILQGRYQILEQKRGGAGQIYYCNDLQSQIPCVLKASLIQFQEGSSREDADLFYEETKNLIDLPPHGNVVRLYRVEVIQDICFLVMEWADRSLKDKISEERPFSVDEILRISVGACRGMRHCLKWLSKPDKEFVHGDIKPNNILLACDGEVRIADFGIGGYTTGYASPERLRGETLDCRSDIFSLGKTMQELLACGRRGDSSYSFHEEQLCRIIKKCIAEQARNRFPSFDALEADLENLYQEITGRKVPEAGASIDENKYVMTRACDLASIGEYEKAYKLLSKLTADTGEANRELLAQGYYNIAEILRNNGIYENALEFYGRAAEQDRDTHSWIWANKGVAFRNLGKWEEACRCFERALEIDPYDGPAMENEIDCLIRLDHPDQLRRLFESLQSLYEQRPGEDFLIKNMAYILYIEKDFAGACEYYERYLRRRKDDWDAAYFYAMSLYIECDTTRASEYFRRAVHMMTAGGSEGETPTKLLYLAISFHILLDDEKAENYLRRFLSKSEAVPQSEHLGKVMQNEKLIGEQYYPALSETGRQLYTITWTNCPQQFYTGIIENLEIQRKQWERELPDGNCSRLTRHMFIVCFSYEAIAFMELGKYQEASDTCDKALFWDHSSPENLFNKGQSLCFLERYEEALECLEQALSQQKDLDRRHDITEKIQEVKEKIRHSIESKQSLVHSMLEAAEQGQGNPAGLQKLIAGWEDIVDEEFLSIFTYSIRDTITDPISDGLDKELFTAVRRAVLLAGTMQQIHGKAREIFIEGSIAVYGLLESYAFEYGGVFTSFMPGIQPFLGLAYLYRIRGSREENIEKSISLWKDCEEMFSGRAEGAVLAEIYDNLGNAYVNRVAGAREENLAVASRYYEKGLAFTSEASNYGEWAMLQYNIGVCESRKNNREKAARAFQNSLRYHTVRNHAEYYAKAKIGLGDIFLQNAADTTFALPLLGEALECYQNAVSCLEQHEFPEERAALFLRMVLVMKKRYKQLRDDSLELARSYYGKIESTDLPDEEEVKRVYEDLGRYLADQAK